LIKKVDKLIITITFLMIVFSFITLYSSCHQNNLFVRKDIFFRQIFWSVIGVLLMFIFSRLDYRKLWDFVWPFYIFILFTLLLVLFLGASRMGAQRWLDIGILNFQPSEFAKLSIIILLSRKFAKVSVNKFNISRTNILWLETFVFPLKFVLIPLILVMLQPDLGTALMLIFIFLMMSYFVGVKNKYIFSFLGISILFFPLFWHFLRPYQKNRLLVFLNPNRDPLGAGYTIIQSKIAIGSGRIFGKGWLGGTQNQLNFLTERHTDFIFSTIGEEWGLVGGLFLIFLFFVLSYRIVKISRLVSDPFAKNICGGIASWLTIQAFINLAMTMGIMPVVGLPLPLFSYGGSSLVAFLISFGIILNISKNI